MRSNIILAFAVALSLLFTGCGGGGGGGSSTSPPPPVPPVVVTLGGVDFDANQSSLMDQFSASIPERTLYAYGPFVDASNRPRLVLTYSAVVVSGVPGVRLSRQYYLGPLDGGLANGIPRVSVYARAMNGSIYVISNDDGAGWSWVASASEPSRLFIKASPLAGDSYVGGYWNSADPSEHTVTTPSIDRNSPLGLFGHCIQVRNGIDADEFVAEDAGIVEIDTSQYDLSNGWPLGTEGWAVVIPSSG